MDLDPATTTPTQPPSGLGLLGASLAPPRLCVTLFGRMQAINADGGSLLPRVRRSRAALAVLAMTSPHPVLRDQLAGLLWSGREREQARGSLRQSVRDLQDQLRPLGNDLLRTAREQIALHEDGVWVDAQAVARATPTRPQALSLLHGELVEDLAGLDPKFDRWRSEQRQRLLRGAVLVAEAILASAVEPDDRIAAAERLAGIDPTHEGACRSLMSVHADRGERAAALAAYERCAQALARGAGAAPSSETEALHGRVRHSVRPSEPPPLPRRTTEPAPPLPGVRLGVMPFRQFGAGEDDGLSMGLAEEITASLARFRWIFLIASPSLAVLADAPDAARMAELDLDFVLDGSIQRANGQIRVIVRLIDLREGVGGQTAIGNGGELVWTHRFDRSGDDLLTLQDEIASETVAQVDPALLLRAGRRASARSKSTTDATAYELVMRAVVGMWRLEEAHFRAAGTLLAGAIARDPGYAAAHAWWAYWHVFLVGQGWSDEPAAAMARAGALAERAVALDPLDARALTISGHVRAFLAGKLSDALGLHARALELNPNLPLAWAFSGLAHAYAGQHEAALRHVEQARRLSPFDPLAFFFDSAMAIPHLLRRDFLAALELSRRAASMNPAFSSGFKTYLAALGQLGMVEEAKEIRARLLELEPGFSVRSALARSPLARAEDRATYAEGLRRAGLPETTVSSAPD